MSAYERRNGANLHVLDVENKPSEAVLEKIRQGKGAQSVSTGLVGVRASELTDRAD